MTEQATKGRYGLLVGNLAAGVTVSVDELTGATELGGRSVCHRIEAIEHGEAALELAAAPPAAGSPELTRAA